HDDDDEREYGHAGEDAGRVEGAFRLRNDVAEAAGRAEILSHNRADQRESEARAEARENPGERARDEHMANELPFGRAEHPRVVDQDWIGIANALVGIEEHHEENERHRQSDLRPDAEAEPEQEYRREDHPWDGVEHRDVRVADARDEGRPREREPEGDADRSADDQPQHGFLERGR